MVTPSDITVAVVGHVARQDQAYRLARHLNARLFLDNGELGEWSNHARAWAWARDQRQPWSLVVQDDALPIDGMLDHLSEGLTTLPAPGLVSLYLGTSYPTHWQHRIRRALTAADSAGAAWLCSDTLLHGVAVLAPTRWTPGMLYHQSDKPYDERLSDWAKAAGQPVYYPTRSLVDHDDGPSLVDHPDGRGRTKPRHAWRTGAPEWNNRTARL